MIHSHRLSALCLYTLPNVILNNSQRAAAKYKLVFISFEQEPKPRNKRNLFYAYLF